MHRSDASPVATTATATEPHRHRWHSSACTPWPGKSWRRPKCRLYARGVSVMRGSCVVSHGRPRNISDDDRLSLDDSFLYSPSGFLSLLLRSPLPLYLVQLRLLSLDFFPALPHGRVQPLPVPYEILMKNLRRDKLLFARRGKARETPVRMSNKKKLDYARTILQSDVTRVLKRLCESFATVADILSFRALFLNVEGEILHRFRDTSWGDENGFSTNQEST